MLLRDETRTRAVNVDPAAGLRSCAVAVPLSVTSGDDRSRSSAKSPIPVSVIRAASTRGFKALLRCPPQRATNTLEVDVPYGLIGRREAIIPKPGNFVH